MLHTGSSSWANPKRLLIVSVSELKNLLIHSNHIPNMSELELTKHVTLKLPAVRSIILRMQGKRDYKYESKLILRKT